MCNGDFWTSSLKCVSRNWSVCLTHLNGLNLLTSRSNIKYSNRGQRLFRGTNNKPKKWGGIRPPLNQRPVTWAQSEQGPRKKGPNYTQSRKRNCQLSETWQRFRYLHYKLFVFLSVSSGGSSKVEGTGGFKGTSKSTVVPGHIKCQPSRPYVSQERLQERGDYSISRTVLVFTLDRKP